MAYRAERVALKSSRAVTECSLVARGFEKPGADPKSLIQTALYASEILIARNIGLTIGSDRRNRHNCKGLEIGWNDVRAVYLYQDHLFWGAKNTVSGRVHLDATVLSQDGIIN